MTHAIGSPQFNQDMALALDEVTSTIEVLQLSDAFREVAKTAPANGSKIVTLYDLVDAAFTAWETYRGMSSEARHRMAHADIRKFVSYLSSTLRIVLRCDDVRPVLEQTGLDTHLMDAMVSWTDFLHKYNLAGAEL